MFICLFLNRGIYNKSTIYDWMVFNRVREKFGGNIIRMASGSAPVSDEVMIFARAAFGCPIPEGYGQTEATSGITCSHPFDPQLGTLKSIIYKFLQILILICSLSNIKRSLWSSNKLLYG